ncbi:MAG: protease inhibitor I42 family protein [Alphaproteobacteria bacterium]|nr:protease inhibitor I42 family protein [Alphaproteobacteria bacterium]MCL2505730.1 protease inhibitor I42 family protein [Alphaproteobacteria bacterium]
MKNGKLKRVFLLLAFLFVNVSEANAQTISNFAEPIMKISVRKGNTFSVRLDANATTGYTWRLAKPLDAKLLHLLASDYEANPGGLMGAGGFEIWTFDAVNAGVTDISFEYIRPWEENSVPAKQKLIKVNISGY